jgi:hypothetical protein
VIVEPLHEVLLLVTIISDLSGGVAHKLQELLLLYLHDTGGDVVAPELLPELSPGEGLMVLSPVGLPPVQSSPWQLPCCVLDSLLVVTLGDVQLALH